MTTSLDSRAGPTGQSASRFSVGLRMACLASLAAVGALLVVYAPTARAVVEADRARVIGQEDQAFCSRFGVGPETVRYAECVTALGEIRSRHDQRRADLFY